MSSVTFDTLQYAKRLEAGGFDTRQAETLAEAQKDALNEALETQIATKSDIVLLDRRLLQIDGRFTLLQWMVTFNLVFTMAILWKFFS